MKISESIIRDHLAGCLEILEPGLRLQEVEAYLPNAAGTRGFVDILAKDDKERFVLIELKRTDAASREAVHEVLKYIEGMKSHLAVTDREMRVFIVSLEWDELLVPFSSFVKDCPVLVTGVQLVVDAEGCPTAALPVSPLPVSSGRLLAPWHEVRFFDSKKRVNHAISDFKKSCDEKGINDYVVVEMMAADHHRIAETERRLEALRRMRSTFEMDGDSDDSLPRLESKTVAMLYFAMLQMPDEMCLARITAIDEEATENMLLEIEDLEGIERSCSLHENLLDVGRRVRHDGYEIGYPAKFTAFDQSDEWELTKVHRFGALARNQLLSDEAILSDLRGEQGVTRQGYVTTVVRPDEKALSRIERDLNEVLRDNPQWMTQVRQVFEGLRGAEEIQEIQVHVMNPCNTLLHFFLFLMEGDTTRLPAYRIRVAFPHNTKCYIGVLVPNGMKPSLKAILDRHYQGDGAVALMSLNWGGYESDNAKVTRDAGLSYATFSMDEAALENPNEGDISVLTDWGLEPSNRAEVTKLFSAYMPGNRDFIQDVIDLFQAWNGFMVDYSAAHEFRPST
jgi:hypothetical protein